jgi:hypothetical protein
MAYSQGVALGWYAPPPWGGRIDVLSGYEARQSGENVPNHFPAGSRILNWWSLSLRFYDEGHHRGAIRTRPMLTPGNSRASSRNV